MKNFLKKFSKNITIILVATLIIEIVYCCGLSLITCYKNKDPVETDIFETAANESTLITKFEERIPLAVRSAIKNDNWELKTADAFVQSAFTQIAYGSGVAGYANSINNTVVLDPSVYRDVEQADETFAILFLHEYGHVVDDAFGIPSQSKEFLELYNNHKNDPAKYYSDYTLSQPSEFFADSFMIYTVNPTLLQDSHSDVIDYFDNFYENIDDYEVSDFTYITRNAISTSYRTIAIAPMILAYIVVASAFVAWRMCVKERKKKVL